MSAPSAEPIVSRPDGSLSSVRALSIDTSSRSSAAGGACARSTAALTPSVMPADVLELCVRCRSSAIARAGAYGGSRPPRTKSVATWPPASLRTLNWIALMGGCCQASFGFTLRRGARGVNMIAAKWARSGAAACGARRDNYVQLHKRRHGDVGDKARAEMVRHGGHRHPVPRQSALCMHNMKHPANIIARKGNRRRADEVSCQDFPSAGRQCCRFMGSRAHSTM